MSGILKLRSMLQRVGLLVLLTVLGWPAAARAHGEDLTIVFANEPIGPYRVTVQGDLHPGIGMLEVIPLLDGAQAPLSTTVELLLRPVRQQQPLHQVPAKAPAPGHEAWRAFVPFEQAGEWQVDLRIDGPAGPAEISFTLQVGEPSRLLQLLLLLFPLVAVVLGAGLWLLVRRRPARQG